MRLSGITRADGGGPASSRARRRASFAAENFFRLALRFLKGRSRLADHRTIAGTYSDGDRFGKIFDELRE